METASPEVVLHVLQLMRLLLRDPVYQTQFLSMNKASVLAEVRSTIGCCSFINVQPNSNYFQMTSNNFSIGIDH